MEKQQVEPVVVVFPNGQVMPGPGYTIGDVLTALDAARNAVLGVVLRQPAPVADTPAAPEQEGDAA